LFTNGVSENQRTFKDLHPQIQGLSWPGKSKNKIQGLSRTGMRPESLCELPTGADVSSVVRSLFALSAQSWFVTSWSRLSISCHCTLGRCIKSIQPNQRIFNVARITGAITTSTKAKSICG